MVLHILNVGAYFTKFIFEKYIYHANHINIDIKNVNIYTPLKLKQ